MKNLIAFLGLIGFAMFTASRVQAYQTATATAEISGGFVVGFTITDGGSGYTSPPLVAISGGGGSGATATANISGGAVTSLTVVATGSGYTSTPEVTIAPPVVPQPKIVVSPATDLYFTGLVTNMYVIGGYFNWSTTYFLMEDISGVWTNQNFSYGNGIATYDGTYSSIVNGTANTNQYALALFPIPVQAFATAFVTNGFVTQITVNGQNGGYLTDPTVQIVGGGGSGAQAVASISPDESGAPNDQVYSITVTSPGSGYTSAPAVVISPPTATLNFATPPQIIPMVRLDLGNTLTNSTYQLQASPDLVTWTNVGASYTASSPTNTTYLYATNSAGFFRLEYIP
jgi:hypothetical protein